MVYPDWTVTLALKGDANIAELDCWIDFPASRPVRYGLYRVRFAGGEIAKSLWEWDGCRFRNEAITLSEGSIVQYQGLMNEYKEGQRVLLMQSTPKIWRNIDEQD